MNQTTYERRALWVWAALFFVGLGWEIWTLFASPQSFPTLSAVTHFFEQRRLGQWMLYVVWLWWGWAILTDYATIAGTRSRRVTLIAAALVMGLWTSGLPFGDAARWVSLLLPTGALLALSASPQTPELEVAIEGRSA